LRYLPKIAIIGAGPAGIAAAIQLKRYGLTPMIFEGGDVGGLLKNARLVENYPGFPKGITGPGLVTKLKQHLKRTGFEVVNEKVTELDYSESRFRIYAGLIFSAEIVIIASGTRPRMPDKPIINEQVRDRVFSEVDPIRNIADKRVIIIGAGDAAFDYALNLAGKNEVIILNRSSRIKALHILQEETAQSPNIKYFEDTSVRKINESGDGCVTVTSEREKRTIEMEADYVIFAVGREPALSFVTDNLKKQMLELQDDRKLYLIGDVKNGIYRQAAIAAGDGVRAAMEIYRSYNS